MLHGVSIIICTYNGRKRIATAIQSVLRQSATGSVPWELLLIDNDSTDGTYEFCVELIEKSECSHSCRLIRESKQGAAWARKRGLFEAKYSWILFVDDDNELEDDYVEVGWRIIQSNPGIGALGGLAIGTFEIPPPDWFNRYSLSYAVGPQASVSGRIKKTSARKIYSAGSFYNRIPLLKYYKQDFDSIMIGPSGNELTRGEDTEWCFMIELSGFFLYYSDELRFYHLMTKGRMVWDYLERLKVGNASGIARLQSYEPFYRQKDPGIFIFWRIYLTAMVKFQLLSLKYRFLKQENCREFALSRKVIEAKAHSYIMNMTTSFRHFKELKKALRSINLDNP